MQWIKNCIDQMKPNAVMVFSHGTLSSDFLKFYEEDLVGNDLVMAINRDYQTGSRPPRISLDQGEI